MLYLMLPDVSKWWLPRMYQYLSKCSFYGESKQKTLNFTNQIAPWLCRVEQGLSRFCFSQLLWINRHWGLFKVMLMGFYEYWNLKTPQFILKILSNWEYCNKSNSLQFIKLLQFHNIYIVLISFLPSF